MNRTKKLVVIASLLLGLTSMATAAPKLNLDALLDQGKPSEAAQQSVKTKTDSLTDLPVYEGTDLKATAARAVATGAEGAKIIEVPSGNCFVATGQDTYDIMKNLNASRLAKREAYMRAFLRARVELARALKGLSLEARERYLGTTEARVTADTSEQKTAGNREVDYEAKIEALLRNYVTFAVSDDGHGIVSVSVAVSPNTLTAAEQTGGVISTDSLEKGVERVMAQVRQGVAAPVGAALVKSPDGDGSVVVSYGSAILLADDDGTTSPRSRLNAQRQARRSADVAMVAFLAGDQVLWETGDKESHKTSSIETPDARARADAERQKFLSATKDTEMMSSAIRGDLPPGVSATTWIDGATGWCYAVDLYQPALTAEARKMADGMAH